MRPRSGVGQRERFAKLCGVRQHFLSSIRGFFRFLVDEHRRERDPTELLEGPKLIARLPDILNRDEVLRLLGESLRAVLR